MVFPTNEYPPPECPITRLVREALDVCDKAGINGMLARVAYVYGRLTDAEELEHNPIRKANLARIVYQLGRLYT